MTATMYNPNTKAFVYKVDTKFIPKWLKLGFEVSSYDSDKIIMLKVS